MTAPLGRSAGRRVSPGLALLSLVLFVVSGCYLPGQFECDLRITAAGDYNFQYRGELYSGYVLKNLADGELSPAEMQEKVGIAQRDLARDPHFSSIEYAGNGRFDVAYERVGNILAERSYNFVRFNSRFITFYRGEDGRVKILGDKPDQKTADAIIEAGIQVRGRLRVQTDARVIDHNAESVVQGGAAPIYVWNIEGFDRPAPELIFEPAAPPQ